MKRAVLIFRALCLLFFAVLFPMLLYDLIIMNLIGLRFKGATRPFLL